MPTLFDPLQIGPIVLPLRLVRSATAERLDLAQPGAGRRLGDLYAERVRGGVGLVITGHLGVHPTGRAGPFMPDMQDAVHAGALREAADRVHAAGGRIMAQLNHAGGRAQPESGEPVCVTSLPDRPRDPMRGAPLDAAMIAALVEAFGRAAARAREAGLDGVEIHAAHGYLGSQFLSPATNRRTDAWGGSLENRARFLREVVRAVRAAVGSGFPVGMKLGAADDDPDGLQIEDTLRAAGWFQADGLDFIEISGAFHAGICARRVRPGAGEGYYLPWARRFKATLSIPVIAVGGFRSLAAMNAAIGSGACDAVAVSRPLIRQPDFLQALRRGDPVACVSCSLCLFRNDRPTECVAASRGSGRRAAGA